MFGRRKVATLVAEFLGTGVLTLLVLSVQRSTIGVPFFVALAAGLTIALMSFALARTSGGYFNPALTIAMWTARKLPTVNTILFVGVQLLGGWAAYGLYTYFVNQSLQPVGGDFTGRILVAEAVGAGIFAFGWSAAVYQRLSPAVSSSIAGLALIVGIIAASSASIGLLNPAVALGARAWVWGTYVLGPVLGAVIGVNLYGLLFADVEAAVAKPVQPFAPEPVVVPAKSRAKATTAKRGKTTAKPASKKPAAKRKTTAKKR
ncbi:MAG: aquaporin [Candidatus Saccharibacteria bacterium]|nr:aquaporin [Candidatus Saccharibacteria bacterium]